VALLDVKDLSVHYTTRARPIRAVDGVTFSLQPGQVLGVVGESGCGKTTAALALMGLLPDTARVTGQILFDGRDLVPLSQEELRRIRWREISMIFQGAMNALTPVYTVGEQIVEAILAHEPHVRERDARARVGELYEAVGLPIDRRDDYPHQYSGGMKQRAVIAMSLACDPKLVIADEPTTALDVMVQDRILRELRRIQRERRQSMLYISHDMAVVAEIADAVAVMYAGKIVEMGPTGAIYARPVHPYTGALMASTPTLSGPRRRLVSLPGAPPNLGEPPPGCPFHPRCPRATEQCVEQHPPLAPHRDGLVAACWHPLPPEGGIALIEEAFGVAAPEPVPLTSTAIVDIAAVNKVFPVGKTLLRRPRRYVHAVNDVSLSIRRGEAFGLVGQSGSGKTTLGRLIVGLEAPTGGTLRFQFNGSPLDVGAIERRELRRQVQMIFQDPYESLNPRMTIGRIVAEPLDVLALGDRATREARVHRILERVGLPPATFVERYPHELSGGQRQRVAVARAMVVEPSFVVADEPTSMLDVSVRAGIIDLLLGFKREGVSYLYVTHDLAVARYICDRIAVMREGRIVEMGPTEDVLQNPKDAYTRDLIAAVPVPDPGRRRSSDVSP
jgi:peptide/nickel transport system ATP-binding protein